MTASDNTAAPKVMVYGIKACDTMKKAMTWLEQNGIEFEFHDYKKQGITEPLATRWAQSLPLDQLINKRGTTWRKLSDEDKAELDEAKAVALICAQPSLVKRPLLELGEQRHLGFKPELYAEIFAQA